MLKIKFLPDQKEISVKEGTDLLSAAEEAGVRADGPCGGKGNCGKCRVRLVAGGEEEATPAEAKHLSREQLAEGWVLACQRKVRQNTVVETIPEVEAHQRKTALKGRQVAVKVAPAVKKVSVQLSKPVGEDQKADMERLLEQLPVKNITYNLRELRTLPGFLRQEKFLITAILHGKKLIGVEPGNTEGFLYGLAFDIGTTTIMGSILDLSSGVVLDEVALTNPQKIHGADVISRIIHASAGEDGLSSLQEQVRGAVNDIIKTLTARNGISHSQIYEAVLVGNTAMSHLFLGVNPAYLAMAPYVPAFKESVEVEAAELGLFMNPGARVTVLPNLAGFIGSDTVGMILATDLDIQNKNVLAIDIGTNGELVLASGGRLLACSTAAGPAFEGANIRHGMRAVQGAIESVVVEEEIVVKTIDGAPARGICGSGLIDAVSELIKAGLVEPSGRFIDPMKSELRPVSGDLLKRLRTAEKGQEFVLVYGEENDRGEDIVITQSDLRELQLAKGAIYAGLQFLLTEAGITATDLESIFLAGAFGNYIRIESAITIGLLPQLDIERIISVGNAAGDGAKLALISGQIRKRAQKIKEKVDYVELSTRKEFQKVLINSLAFM